jgi:hypothetical protein
MIEKEAVEKQLEEAKLLLQDRQNRKTQYTQALTQTNAEIFQISGQIQALETLIKTTEELIEE